MTTQQIALLDDLKDVMVKHGARLEKSAVYYAGESEDPRFVLPDDAMFSAYLSIDELAEVTGGWK